MAVDEFGNVIDEGFTSGDVNTTPLDTALGTPAPVPSETQNAPETVAARENVGNAVGNFQALGDAAQGSEESEYAGYEAPSEALEAIKLKEGGAYGTPETKVAWQLEQLLGKDSALSQQSRRKAREGASALGMMSSSVAIGDAQARNVEALSPIAAKDAEIAAKFKLQQQATENKIKEVQVEAEVSGELTVQKAKVSEQATRINQQWDAMTRAADLEGKASLTELQAQLAKEQKSLEADLQRELTQQEIDAGMEQLIINGAQKSMNDYHVSVQQLLSNESFLDLFGGDSTKMNGFFNDMFVSVKSSIAFNAKAAGVYGQPGGDGLYDYIEELGQENLWQ
jgi:hypothetical protein